MWRVVVGRSDDSSSTAGGTLLSSELTAPPPLYPHHPHHPHHQHHWPPPPPASHHHYGTQAAIPAIPPPPPPHHAYEQSQSQDGQSQEVTSHQQQQQQQHHQRSAVKRPLSDSDCDDVFSEESGKEPCNSPGGDSCQHTSRKRRRGMIEKKRRDRINASLGELRRLVPAAARDPHSGKLEKAEILQLTVEHLRTLRNKGAEGYDSTKLAMDYHAVGWGECAAEVGRYLVTMEGLDERDPLRLRLLSHLQSFHREPAQQSQPPPPPPPPPPTSQSNYEPQPQSQQPTSSSSSSSAATNLHLQAAIPPPQVWAQYPGGQYPGSQYATHPQQHGKPYRPWGAELAY